MKRSERELDTEIEKIFETDYYRGKFKAIVEQANPDCPLCDGWGWGRALSSVKPVIRFCCCVHKI